jgi:hypothetical protein
MSNEDVAPDGAEPSAAGPDLPSNDPIGTVRETQGHVYVKLANPAGEPWHIAWCHGEQFMSGWQSDECMVGSEKWDGYLPVRECGTEGRDFVSWERWLEVKRENDQLRAQVDLMAKALQLDADDMRRALAAYAATSAASQEGSS